MNNFLGKIVPCFEKEDFQRKAWIALAKDDVPLDVFDLDFSEATEEYHRVLIAKANYAVTWQADIGNDRQESYTDYETYYEKVPYTDYERKYNTNTRRYDQVPVTKYRKEERQRLVTKYRTVTDWHSGSGEHSGKELFFDSVDELPFAKTRFFEDYNSEYATPLSEEDVKAYPDMKITQSMLNLARSVHEYGISNSTMDSVPGDHNRGFSYQITEYNLTSAYLVRVPEYKTTIYYDGEIYEKRGFPFGNMTVSTTNIPNPISVEAEKKKRQDKTKAENEQREKEYVTKIWNSTKILTLASICFLVLSIAVSLFVHYLWLVIVCFLGGIGLAVFSNVNVNKTSQRIQKEIKDANAAALSACNEAIENYDKEHKKVIFEALNKKLSSLGYAPADKTEFYGV